MRKLSMFEHRCPRIIGFTFQSLTVHQLVIVSIATPEHHLLKTEKRRNNERSTAYTKLKNYTEKEWFWMQNTTNCGTAASPVASNHRWGGLIDPNPVIYICTCIYICLYTDYRTSGPRRRAKTVSKMKRKKRRHVWDSPPIW